VTDEPAALQLLRDELAVRLPVTHRLDDDVLLVAGLLVRQAQTWRGATAGVRVRASTLGRVVNIEVHREIDEDADSGPGNDDSFHGLLDVLADRTDRFTVSTFPGSITLAAQKLVDPIVHEAEIDLRVAA
jgi:hypothetical protein